MFFSIKNGFHSFLLIMSVCFVFQSCAIHHELSEQELQKDLAGDLLSVKDSDVQSLYTVVDNKKFHYLKTGDGPPLILIHGWVCTGYFWKPIMEKLYKNYTVYAVDLMGHGFSEKKLPKNTILTPENQAGWVKSFMNNLSIKKAFVVGHSMGGETAAWLAYKYPESVEKLVLMDAIGLKENFSLIPWYARMTQRSFMINFTPDFFSETMVGFFTNHLMKGKKSKLPDWFVKDVVLQNTNTEEDSKALLKATKEGLFKEYIKDSEVSTISVPTLCLWGREDNVVPVQLAKKYHNLIKTSSLDIVDGAGHLLPVEKPDLVAEKLGAFLR